MSGIELLKNLLLAAMGVAVSAGVATPAGAQIEDLIEINTLAESESGGCYPGTPGSDATMFIRLAPGGTQCDTFDLNNNLCLARREFPGDGANGTSVSFGDMALLRPSVYGDGSVVWFVNNLDLCVMLSDQIQQEACYNLPPSFFVHGIGVEPQGRLLGLIPRDLNNIDVPANAIQIFGIGSYPGLSLLATYSFDSPLLFPETLDFMTRGPWIVFDASTSPFPGGDWGLYLVDRYTSELRTLAAPVPGYQLRNPVFGQTSDDVLAFEAVELATGRSTVLTADLRTGEVRKIAELAINVAIPGFNGDDTALIFNREDPTVFSMVSLRERALLADRITPTGAELPHLSNGGFATIYRRGSFDDSATPCPEPDLAIGLLASTLGLGLWAGRRPRRPNRFGGRTLLLGLAVSWSALGVADARADYTLNGRILEPAQAQMLAEAGLPEGGYWLDPQGYFGVDGDSMPLFPLDRGDLPGWEEPTRAASPPARSEPEARAPIARDTPPVRGVDGARVFWIQTSILSNSGASGYVHFCPGGSLYTSSEGSFSVGREPGQASPGWAGGAFESSEDGHWSLTERDGQAYVEIRFSDGSTGGYWVSDLTSGQAWRVGQYKYAAEQGRASCP